MAKTLQERIENDFSFHGATEETAPKHDSVRAICKDAALKLAEVVPEGRELSVAISCLDLAMMCANAAVARRATAAG